MNDMLGGLLGTLLGGGMAQPQPQSSGGGPLDDVFSGLFGGPAEPQPQTRSQQPQDQGGNIGDILNSPLGKAVLGGIAAYAMQEVMQKTSKR